MLVVDQVVEAIAELHPLVGFRGPCGAGIRKRDHLRRLAIRIGLGVKRIQVLACRPTIQLRVRPIDLLVTGHTLISAGVRLHHRGIDSETFTTHQAGRHAAPHYVLEDQAENIAVAETAMAVQRKGRMIGHSFFQAQFAEPAVGKIEMHL